jgi:4-hydroxythreonine-4-phosphate dehydrogenase
VSRPVILITSGEPAGIGPDICLKLAELDFDARLLILGDLECLRERAKLLNLTVDFVNTTLDAVPDHQKNRLAVWHFPLAVPAIPGQLDVNNAKVVLDMINAACDACQDHRAAAVVTAPVQKSTLHQFDAQFLGHTEYLAKRLRCEHVVMLLVADHLRVALASTHLPLKDVPSSITRENLVKTLTVLNQDLIRRFGISQPRIAVLGLNPHAGESGHLGVEEIDTIAPAIAEANQLGIAAFGPVPADTAFTPAALAHCDAVLAMYHDQGLPVLKALGFDRGVNITCGLSILRTSVDHGTALPLAGTHRADPNSLMAALELAIQCHTKH